MSGKPEPALVGIFRTWPTVLGGLVSVILTAGLGYTGVVTLSGRMLEEVTNHYLAPSNGIGFAITAIVCGVLLIYCVLAFAFDRIVIDGDHAE